MPEIQIRPVLAADISDLAALDHSYTTEQVWQMEIQQQQANIEVTFRETRLPRSVHQGYPRDASKLIEDWNTRPGLLVAVVLDDRGWETVVGYVSLVDELPTRTVRATDLAVGRRFRRQGIATGLLLSAADWALSRGCNRLVVEMQSKNHPAIRLVQKLGFDFCGYSDQYYANHDIALFFGKFLR